MSPNSFKDFDFKLLDSQGFKEDSVREELITPLLHSLGYQAYSEFEIVRSKSLKHPSVMFGSKKQKINIILDYLLKVRSHSAWILEAKSPDQNIVYGKNVEQAYSYAIHPEIRVNLYALCNGRQLTLFHIHETKPILQVGLQDLEELWSILESFLSPRNVLKYNPLEKELTKLDIEAMKAFSRFEDKHSFDSSQFPVPYSVDDLVEDLKIEWNEANEIFNKLRRLGLFEGIFDNLPTFPNSNRPINEASPGRLSQTGQGLLKRCGSDA